MKPLPILIVGALVLAAAFGIWSRAARPDSSGPPTALAPAEPPAQAMALQAPDGSGARALAPPAGVAPAADMATPRADAETWVRELIDALRRAATPGDESEFLEAAHEVLEPRLAVPDAVALDARCEVLAQRLDTDVADPRVRAGVTALLAAWRADDFLLPRLDGQGLAWRSAVQGMARAGVDERACVLRPADFLERNPRGEHGLLPWSLTAMPEPPWIQWIQQRVITPAEDFDALLDRDLAVLALGTRLDADPATLDFFTDLLRDPAQRQIRPSLVFALAHASSEAARQVLLAFLEDDQAGEWGKFGARWLIAEHGAGDGEIDLLMAPLLDPTSTAGERLTATGFLMSRLDGMTEEAAAPVVELLSARVLDEPDETARLAAISTLGLAPGGREKLGALDAVLRRDASPACRLWAVQGLALTSGSLTGEARALLEAARATEDDPQVLEAITTALDG